MMKIGFSFVVFAAFLTEVFGQSRYEDGKLTGRIGSRSGDDCRDVPLFINFDHNPDGSKNKIGELVGPDRLYQGGSVFAVRDKSHNDDLYDDGIVIKNGGTTLQLAAAQTIRTRRFTRKIPRASRYGAEIIINFEHPVIAHSLLLLDPDNDKESYKRYHDYGRIHFYGRKLKLATIDLPPNNSSGLMLTDPPPRIFLGHNTAAMINLGNRHGVLKMVIDLGDGGWKAIDRIKITAPCDNKDHSSRESVVVGSPFSRLSISQRQAMIDAARRNGAQFEFPQCVGKSFEECQELIYMVCPECSAKSLLPPMFNFYRIHIFCDENGKVKGVPRRR